jgi:hypothetical protein
MGRPDIILVAQRELQCIQHTGDAAVIFTDQCSAVIKVDERFTNRPEILYSQPAQKHLSGIRPKQLD